MCDICSIKKKNEWGPVFWTMFHLTAEGYSDNPTETNKAHMKNFIRAIPTLIPCDECRPHASYFINKRGLIEWAAASRPNLRRFFFTFHNSVNEALGKPIFTDQQYITKFHLQ